MRQVTFKEGFAENKLWTKLDPHFCIAVMDFSRNMEPCSDSTLAKRWCNVEMWSALSTTALLSRPSGSLLGQMSKNGVWLASGNFRNMEKHSTSSLSGLHEDSKVKYREFCLFFLMLKRIGRDDGMPQSSRAGLFIVCFVPHWCQMGGVC